MLRLVSTISPSAEATLTSAENGSTSTRWLADGLGGQGALHAGRYLKRVNLIVYSPKRLEG
jgi:hypothetical protein